MNYINKDKNYMTDAERIRYLEESIRELRKEKDLIRKEKWEYHHKIIELEQENKKLKKDLAFKETMLDNVSAEYDSLQNIIRKLNRRIKELEQCNLNLQTWIDNKEKVNKQLREELQRFKDLWDSWEI